MVKLVRWRMPRKPWAHKFKERPCNTCGAFFLPRCGRSIFCSPQCRPCQYTPRAKRYAVCTWCETLFHQKSGSHLFCSGTCSAKMRAHRERQVAAVKLGTRLCSPCGGQFKMKTGNQLYCGKRCAARAAKRRKPGWVEPITNEAGVCLDCKITLPIPRPSSKKYCSERCVKRAQKRRSDRIQRTKPHVHIRRSLSGRLRDILKRKRVWKNNSILKYLGCTLKELAAHIENKFTPDLSWANYGVFGWHVDHYVPCSRFDLAREDHRAVCFHWRNLRPLWGETNWRRADVVTDEERQSIDPELVKMIERIGVKL